jgi:hypothetical protein
MFRKRKKMMIENSMSLRLTVTQIIVTGLLIII